MDIERLFNEEVMSLDTYIMFKLKEQTAKLKDELTARNRAPIFHYLWAHQLQTRQKP